jgi:dephospho-CoA kinase
MKLIGLTGGIGSGKSTVAGMFQILGIPVYESDSMAKSLMTSDKPTKEKIIDLFGQEAYLGNDHLNKSYIASIVFADTQKLDQLNAIVHPAVYSDLMKWSDLETQKGAPYLIQESAILFEENLTDRFEAIILVVADQETRISRVMARDKVSRDKILKRVQHQWRDEKKIPLSDYVIFNDGERSLITQVTYIDKMIKIRVC